MKQQGLSLSEMIIGLFLASLIMTALMQHYLKAKQQYVQSQKTLENAFEWQLVSDLIRDSVRRAGFTPCLSINLLKTLDRRNGQSNLTALEVKNSRSLHIKRMSEHFSPVKSLAGKSLLAVTNRQNFVQGQVILIADCYHAEVQQISAVHKTEEGTLLTMKEPLAFSYDLSEVYVGEWLEEVFFVQKNNRNQLALFYQLDHPEELSPLINKLSITRKEQGGTTFLQVLLGIDKAQDGLLEVMVRAR